MAQFGPAYKRTSKNEGGYANVSGDAETYMGINRDAWPNWEGWPTIDEYKRQLGGHIPWNEKFNDPKLQSLVDDFYYKWWKRYGGDGIRSQELAEMVYDLSFNASSGAITQLQQALNKVGLPTAVDGSIGPDTIRKVNAAPQVQLFRAFKSEMDDFYRDLAKRKPAKAKFLPEWISRLDRFTAPLTDYPDVKKKPLQA